MVAFTDGRRLLRDSNWDLFGIQIAITKIHNTLVDLEALTWIMKLMAIQYHKDIQSAASCLYSEG